MGSLDSSSQCHTVKFTLRNLQHQHYRFPILHQLWGVIGELFVYDLGAGFFFSESMRVMEIPTTKDRLTPYLDLLLLNLISFSSEM